MMNKQITKKQINQDSKHEIPYKSIISVAVISAGAVLYISCPSKESFQPFFDQWYETKLFPLIKRKLKGRKDTIIDPNKNDLMTWFKNATKSATNTIKSNLIFGYLFPESPKVSDTNYGFRIARIKMYVDEYPNGIELVFIGAGNTWFLNPLQGAVLTAISFAVHNDLVPNAKVEETANE